MRNREKERRRLVGRRYEDFLRHGIDLELSVEEQVWQALFGDPRFQSLLDRRRTIRRREEQPAGEPAAWFQSHSAALLNLLSQWRTTLF